MRFMLLLVLPLLPLTFGPGAQDPQDGMPKPGPEHARLIAHVGTWDAVVISEGPDGTPQRDKATMVTRDLGGFHAVDEFEGQVMGMKFTGHGINSYCPLRKRYVSSWVDSMTPSPMTLTGTYDKKANEIEMTGECLGMSGKLEPCRSVTLFGDADHFAWEMYGAGPDGKEMRHLRIEYTRRR
ncbi:MAG: DUF1579 domain-containing protein [Planctomycetes bacterium]|nr:DUF1579 domain-containing protein [Planctomycetota bacterium]